MATPFGWAVVVVGGIFAGNYIGNKTSEVVEYTFDSSKNFANQHPVIGESLSRFKNIIYSAFEQMGQSIMEN